MAEFPSTLKTFTTKKNDVDFVVAEHVNTLQDELAAVQTFVGTNADGAVVKGTKTQTLTNKTLTRPELTNTKHTKFTATDQATVDFDFNNGDWGVVTLGDNRTFTFTNGQTGGYYIVQVIQDGTGSRTVTWPASVDWPGGTVPTLTTAANGVDFIGFIFDGTNFFGVAQSLDLK